MFFSLLLLINQDYYNSVIIIIIESSPPELSMTKMTFFSWYYIMFSECYQNQVAATTAEKEVIEAICKQNDEVKKQQEKVKNLVDRIAAEIERTSCFEGR